MDLNEYFKTENENPLAKDIRRTIRLLQLQNQVRPRCDDIISFQMILITRMQAKKCNQNPFKENFIREWKKTDLAVVFCECLV